MTDVAEPGWEAWMDKPLTVDQPEGVEATEPDTFQMQVRESGGMWRPLGTPRADRDEVTRLQAYYINKDSENGEDGEDGKVRVLRRRVVWIVDEVPGDGEGQTPASAILARNDQITQDRFAEHTRDTQ